MSRGLADMTREAPGFFEVDEWLAELSAKDDDLERLNTLVDFDLFRRAREAVVPHGDRSKGGRPPFDYVFMFKILILQPKDRVRQDLGYSAKRSYRCAFLTSRLGTYKLFLSLITIVQT
ncbi:hypothetical protein A1351_20415 [Methylosinus sp. R-45379]|nr:hypothetical protein A1351_20415 [Methylosinus sp. R-45379]